MFKDLLRFAPRNLVPQRIHTELFLRGLLDGKDGHGSSDQLFSNSGMDEFSVKSCFDILDEKFGKQLKSNDRVILDATLPTAVHALLAIIEYYSQATSFGTKPYPARKV